MRWISVLVGAFGGLGGVVVAAWERRALSSSYEPVLGALSETEVRAFLIVVLALFSIAVVAAVLSLKTPRISGLTLIVSGGVSVALSLFAAAAIFFGGVYLIPFGFLVLVAGVTMVTRS